MERTILKTKKEVELWFQGKGTQFAFDTETTALKYTELELEGISFANQHGACYIDLVNNPQIDGILEFLRFHFDNALTLIIAHNIVFDMKVLHKYGIKCYHLKLYDTMVADHLIDENRRHGLKFLAEEILEKRTVSYEEARSYGADSEEFYEYATNDAVWTWELCMYQQPHLRDTPPLAKLFRDIEMPFQFVLLEMEINGMGIDTEEVTRLREELQEERRETLIEMARAIDVPYELQFNLTDASANFVCQTNFDSPKQLAEILFNKLGLDVVEQTPSGAPSVGKSTLEHYKTNPFVKLLYKYKIIQKALSAYLNEDAQILSNLESDNRVRTNFRDTGTKTGRLSSSNPNVQQLSKPNEVYPIFLRKCFVATPGYKMITADYSGQEVCVAAQISKDPTLIDALRKGKDIHLTVANQFYELGIPEEKLFETHPEFEELKKQYKTQRTQAKVITFGLMYGKGAFGLSHDFGITEDEAQVLIDKYFEGMPNIKQAIENSHLELQRQGYVEYLSGRRRRFEKIKKDDWEGYAKKSLRQCFNALIQGYSADMIRIAANNIYKQKENYPEWGIKLIGTVHDEIIVECRTKYAEQVAEHIKQWMEEPFSWMDIPIKADTDIGDNYNDAK